MTKKTAKAPEPLADPFAPEEPATPPSAADAKKGKYTPAQGAAARLATMTPTRTGEKVGQVETTSGVKKG